MSNSNCPDSYFSTVASFDSTDLHIHFNAAHFPLVEVQQSKPDLNMNSVSGWMDMLRNVPSSVLVHELAHVFHTAATPTGLRDYFFRFVAEYAARLAIEEASDRFRGVLPVGLNALYRQDEVSESLSRAKSLQASQAFRIGGPNLFGGGEHVAGPLDGTPFFHSEDNADVISVLGVHHLYESLGGVVEILRAEFDDNDIPVLPVDPYRICEQFFRHVRPQTDGLNGHTLELAIVIDTALLEDDWYLGNPSTRAPSAVFLDLLEVLSEDPTFSLRSMEAPDVAEFQNQLMVRGGFNTPDVQTIAINLRQATEGIFTEIRDTLTSIPELVIRDYRACVEKFQDFRIQEFGGACPLELLVFGSREILGALVSNVPSGSNGREVPFESGMGEYSLPFVWQKARHIRPVLDEVVFGPRPCKVRDNCALAPRAACRGVTDNLLEPQSRCAREAVIGEVMEAFETVSALATVE